MSFGLPFTALTFLHRHLTHLVSGNDDRYDFVDANKIPYAVRYNKEKANYFTVADENGFIKIFTTHPKLMLLKEFSAQKSCIYDLQWLNGHELACGGGDQFISVFDLNTCTRLAMLKGHSESVKSITLIPFNPFVIASGSRDGSVLIFDTRCNRHTEDSDPNVSYIKAVNSIQPAHFVDNNGTGSNSFNSAATNRNTPVRSNILKSKSSNPILSTSFGTQQKRPSPVACVSFQNEHLIVSAGATDGLIKVWDIRKIYARKNYENIPVFVFDNQLRRPNTSPLSKLASKGFSNLVFNSSRSRLYANCLNGQLYEYNFSTYKQLHTRSLSSCDRKDENNKPKLSHHSNQSNFIKSSLSHCENFILTGSSDFNAYIYSTNINSLCNEFKQHMPVIVLKGHTNEVTCVDWNPFDSNQLITCSDDNTMRLWNVKRDIDQIKSAECNFSSAETLQTDQGIDDIKFFSYLRNSNRTYNKYLPNVTSLTDDPLMITYEFDKHINIRPHEQDTQQQATLMQIDDFEKELCIKCQNISIDIESTSNSVSPVSQNIKSIENELCNIKNKDNEFNFIHLETPLSNLPINIIEQIEPDEQVESNAFSLKKQVSSTALIPTVNSFQMFLNESKSKTISLKHQTRQNVNSSPHAKAATSHSNLIKNPNLSTSKKRSWESTTNKEMTSTDSNFDKESGTRTTKRRLIMNNISSPATATAISSPQPNKTILHYFTPVLQQSK